MRRGLALFVLVCGALPLCGATPWDVDAEGRIGGGRMPHLVPGGCGPETRGAWYGGAGGRVEVSPDRSPQTRLLLAGEADLRVARMDAPAAGRPQGLLLFRASPSVGFDSEYFELMVGSYVTNDKEREDLFGFPSVGMRIGARDFFWVVLDMFDEPACFLSQCFLGASYGIVLTDDAILNQGFSLGLGGARTWLRIPFATESGWWVFGSEAGLSDDDPSFALTLGARTPWAI